MSRYVEKSRRGYYDAYTLTEQNARISGVLDVTPFLVYFIEHVYHQLEDVASSASAIGAFQTVLERGGITEKEKDLWHFVLSAYGNGEFSTKQLERDFGNAAYATILSFVLSLRNSDFYSLKSMATGSNTASDSAADRKRISFEAISRFSHSNKRKMRGIRI